MPNIFFSSLSSAACVVAVLLLTACNPTYDWREVHGAGAPYTVTLPAKPASVSRTINIAGTDVTMTMTAAEVNNVTFAVGTAELPDADEARRALDAMKTALVKNINGVIRRERHTETATAPATIEIEAVGPPGSNTGSESRALFARFIAKDKRVYQLVVVGKEKAVTQELVDTFFTSFRTD